MKARIWKDREAGVWCYSIDHGGVSDCPTWTEALSEVLAEIGAHRAARM